MKSNGDGPVVAIDIDGTLGDYHTHFLRFAEAWYGRPMPDARDINPGLPLHKFMQTSKSTYRKCKLAYRQGGLERSMPIYPGARELIVSTRKAGAEVWLCTTRPYLKYDQLYTDTLHCLKRNRLPYDAVIHGERKYRDLARIVGRDRVAAVLDDLPEMIIQATSLGMDGIIRDQPYNKHFSWHLRAMDMDDALNGIMYRLKIWYDKNGR